MKINKQLFEDVLLGKLKGTFVLRCGKKCFSSELARNYNHFSFTHPYMLDYRSYTPKGMYSINDNKYEIDIVDFIPDINMKKNELTIEIPEGKIVDWDESKKQNKLVLKDKQLTYKDICGALYKDKIVYYTDVNGGIVNMPFSEMTEDTLCDLNNASTKHQLECILAKNKLANVAKYLNGEWKPYKTDLGHFDAWVLFATPDKDFIRYSKITDCTHNSNILFRSPELAKQAVEILGEETIKLALEPL